MVFSSIPFLYYFLPVVLICYFLVPFRLKNLILLIFSLLFYSWGEPRYVFLMVISIFLAYGEGIFLEKAQGKKAAGVLAAACCVHIGLLLYFKYADFFIENMNALGLELPLLKIALPIGISFYTFQLSGGCVSERLQSAEESRFFWGVRIHVSSINCRSDCAVQ